jgi:hypothetical protein
MLEQETYGRRAARLSAGLLTQANGRTAKARERPAAMPFAEGG